MPSSARLLTVLLVVQELERRRVGSDDQPGEDVAQDDRLAEAVEDHRHQAGDDHDDREILEQRLAVHDARLASGAARVNLNRRRKLDGGQGLRAAGCTQS